MTKRLQKLQNLPVAKLNPNDEAMRVSGHTLAG